MKLWSHLFFSCGGNDCSPTQRMHRNRPTCLSTVSSSCLPLSLHGMCISIIRIYVSLSTKIFAALCLDLSCVSTHESDSSFLVGARPWLCLVCRFFFFFLSSCGAYSMEKTSDLHTWRVDLEYREKSSLRVLCKWL